MELRNLAAFVEVIRSGCFSVAATTLYRSQPAVSRAVRQLEDELGVSLIERTPEGARLTKAGEMAYGRAVNILAECDVLTRDMRELAGARTGVLRLGLPVMGGSLLFTRHYAAYCADNPLVEIQLVERDTADLPQAVRNGEAEVAFAIRPIPADFEAVSACREPGVVVVWPDHPLAGRSGLSIPDLANWPIVMPHPASAAHAMVTAAFARHGITPRIATYSRQIQFMVALVAERLGLAIVPRLGQAGPEVFATVRTMPLNEDLIVWHGCFIWKKNARLSPPARAWVDMAVGKCAWPEGLS